MINRASMAEGLTLSPAAPTKTFVLEAHSDGDPDYLRGLFKERGHVERTDDAFLSRLHLGDGTFWVDQLDDRFWSFHTNMRVKKASPILRDVVNARRDVDWMWLPSDHLRYVWPSAVSRRVHTEFLGNRFLDPSVEARDLKVQYAGVGAERLLELIARDATYRPTVSFSSVQVLVEEREFGTVSEGVMRMGRFQVSGDSLEFHLQFVRAVVQRYRRLVEACEERALSWSAFEGGQGGGRLSGCPLTIQFTRTVTDLERFLDELLSAREPFRLWGVPEVTDGVAEVDAVDLHVGSVLPMDVGGDWMRVYLPSGACGNTIARLISNLQHRFDGALTVTDPQVQEAISNRPAASAVK